MQHFYTGVIFAALALFLLSNVAKAASIISVPFTSQAPLGSWGKPYQDFCEEASIVMAAHFVWGAKLSAEVADVEMKIIKSYEEVVFSKYKDTSVEETASIFKNLYGLKNISVSKVSSTADIKKEILVGKIVIVPVLGRMLKNPYFTPPGPFYHMLVVTGFDDSKNVFITNDPGTRRGKDLTYRQSLLLDAVHDWNNGDVPRGEKIMIVVGRYET